MKDNQFPSKRSRCHFCLFNCSGERAKLIGMDWEEIITDEPVSFLKACFFDEELRKTQATGRKKMLSIPYFHFSRTPLSSVYQKEYIELSKLYKPELEKWKQEWQTFLSNKYGAAIESSIIPQERGVEIG